MSIEPLLMNRALSAVYGLLERPIEAEDEDETLTEDYDPTPYCSGCRAKKEADCKCGPIADNE